MAEIWSGPAGVQVRGEGEHEYVLFFFCRFSVSFFVLFAFLCVLYSICFDILCLFFSVKCLFLGCFSRNVCVFHAFFRGFYFFRFCCFSLFGRYVFVRLYTC